MTIGGPRNEPDGPPTSLGATETGDINSSQTILQ